MKSKIALSSKLESQDNLNCDNHMDFQIIIYAGGLHESSQSLTYDTMEYGFFRRESGSEIFRDLQQQHSTLRSRECQDCAFDPQDSFDLDPPFEIDRLVAFKSIG